MDSSLLKSSSNWSQIGGCSFSQAFQVHTADPDVFVKPHLDEIVDENKSVLLSKENSSEYCELYVNIFPQYKIQAISFACNIAKVEIFQGPIKEYLETIYGVVVDDSDDQFKSYRYDVEIEKSGVTDLTIRFLTDSRDVCIFGVMLFTAPNPNGITTLLPNASGSINPQNVKNILENSTKHNAEKYKQLLGLMARAKQPESLALGELMQQKLNIVNEENAIPERNVSNEENFKQIKTYIDESLRDMEERISKQLESIEQRQMQKLDNILAILEKTKY